MLTVEKVFGAYNKAKREYGNVLIVFNEGRIKAWGNNGSDKPRADVEVIKQINLDAIDRDIIMYKNEPMNLKQFVDKVNEDYKEAEG